jgi:hypothetical protein
VWRRLIDQACCKERICMAFKLIVFIAILVAVAVLGMRGYRASVQGFEREHAALPGGDDAPVS